MKFRFLKKPITENAYYMKGYNEGYEQALKDVKLPADKAMSDLLDKFKYKVKKDISKTLESYQFVDLGSAFEAKREGLDVPNLCVSSYKVSLKSYCIAISLIPETGYILLPNPVGNL